MGTITVAGIIIETDWQGNLVNRLDWNEEVARAMAKADNIELTPGHWEVIHFLRAYFEEYQIAPPVRVLIKAMGKRFERDTDKDIRKYLYELFPEGPARQACRYSGFSTPAVTV